MTKGKRPRFGELVFYELCRTISVGISWLYFPGPVLHKERLPKRGAYVLAPVHRSYVDWLVVARVSKRRLCYLVKGEVWNVRSVGKLLEWLGAFPVRRGAADREAVRQAVDVLLGGEPLVVFPEGTRGSGSNIETLLEGAVYIALRANVPIVPIGIGGAERAMPRGAKLACPAWTRVVIGNPIPPLGTDGGRDTRIPRSAIREQQVRLHDELQRAFSEAEGHAE